MDNELMVSQMTNAPVGSMVTSIECSDDKQGAILYNAIMSPDYGLSEFINKNLFVTDYVCQTIEIEDNETGETVQAVRTVIIDKDGKSYGAVSNGIVQSLATLKMVFNVRDWHKDPVEVTVVQPQYKGGRHGLALKAVVK